MCGIAAILDLKRRPVPDLGRALEVMNELQLHRGPDDGGTWAHPSGHLGFAHRRLSIIDLSASARQPMTDRAGNWITFNGEIYNYVELRAELGQKNFVTKSDTEVILFAYRRWGADCVNHFRGMFSFALWDEESGTLLCARDRFGIKPLYYMVERGVLYVASEAKALLPFASGVETDPEGLKDYLAFQFCLGGKTMFRGISELPPGHVLSVRDGVLRTKRYWEVYYTVDEDHTSRYFEERLRLLMNDSIALHRRSDVPIGAYVSGGLDSSVIASLAGRDAFGTFQGFTGKFSLGPEYDESAYARALAAYSGFELFEVDITAADFIGNIERIIYTMDYPVAGPGSIPQYMVSQLASRHRKVALGGQGGDEVFGGYTRYLIAYFEQCIKAAIDGTTNNGNFVVTYESIIPNLVSLRNYKPMMQEFWRTGMFEEMDKRYFRLINRSPQLDGEIRWERLGGYSPYDSFREIFNSSNVGERSYFDRMTHFDFKTLLPALLHVEDRMSMAHGLESRVPLLDHPLVEFAATVPANVKFKDGTMKHLFKNAFQSYLPETVAGRKDKMGFPTPLVEWVRGEARDFTMDLFSSQAALSRDIVDNRRVLDLLEREPKFGRKIWGLMSLELWQRRFHDRAGSFRDLMAKVHA